MSLRGLEASEHELQFDITESARVVRLDLGSVAAVPSRKTNDANLNRFLIHRVHSARYPIQHSPWSKRQHFSLNSCGRTLSSRPHRRVPPSPVPALIPSPQAPSYTQRDLQRQQEVRGRLSGKPDPKASSLIEMYREKERQAASIRPQGPTVQVRWYFLTIASISNCPRWRRKNPRRCHDHLRNPSCHFRLLTSPGCSAKTS